MFPCEYQTQEERWLLVVYYHLAHTLERDTVIGNIVYLVKENPHPLPCSKNVSGSGSNRQREKTSTLMGETCVYLYFDGYIWFDLS